MAKIKSVYICSECGYESPKWYGKCPSCGEWNTMNEEIKDTSKSSPTVKSRSFSSYAKPYSITEISTDDEHRYDTGCKELNRVLGGGIVKGSLILLGGDPGIGKSTVLMQICQFMGSSLKILYVSGEESKRQLKLRANRLGVNSPNLYVMTETDVEVVCEQIKNVKPDLVMVDSIQTMNLTELNSSPGSVTQVRECTNMLMRTAKGMDVPMFVVGHVNKEGSIAGPKVVENPSVMLLSGRPKNVSGTCVTCTIEGSRPILAETQGLATQSGYGNARRMATGYDYNRLSMLLAVLEKRAGYYFSNNDAYINIVGGLRVDEPAIDLSIAMALISSLKDTPVDENAVVFGEIGLAGEIRSVSQAQMRINEAVRLGFTRIVLPYHNLKGVHCSDAELIGVRNIREAFEAVSV